MQTIQINSGDTLQRIADELSNQYNTKVTVDDLTTQNNISDPNMIYAGDTLTFDDSALQQQTATADATEIDNTAIEDTQTNSGTTPDTGSAELDSSAATTPGNAATDNVAIDETQDNTETSSQTSNDQSSLDTPAPDSNPVDATIETLTNTKTTADNNLNFAQTQQAAAQEAYQKALTQANGDENDPNVQQASANLNAANQVIAQATANQAAVQQSIDIATAIKEQKITQATLITAADSDDITIAGENNINSAWRNRRLTRSKGTITGPTGKETYYNLDMDGVVQIMKKNGINYRYWVRSDGCKMYGKYIMCAANLDTYPRGTLVESSLGTCIVCDTGEFAKTNSKQLDIAVNW